MQRKNIDSQILIDVKYISLACEDYLIYTGKELDGWVDVLLQPLKLNVYRITFKGIYVGVYLQDSLNALPL